MRVLVRRGLLLLGMMMVLIPAVAALAQISESEAPPPSTPAAAASIPAVPPANPLPPEMPPSGVASAASGSVGNSSPAAKQAAIPTHFEVEPATARVPVTGAEWIYAAPSTSARRIERSQSGKFVDVTGATRHWLRVQLRSGETGYISPDAVELVKPTDKTFALTRNATVRDKPNQWGKHLAEVHRGHNVHVVGIALNYFKIRMKNGLEGFIPMSALE
ncbi:MAG TPA: SH3 domain-containing protein [Candidatus Binataceae bacterium]|nr:SH3 domain-containing protein [Candidatus Binataceae bacterium]